MNGRYELRKGKRDWSNMRYGNWEVAHFWEDGVTIQVKYFKTRKAAQKYLDEKTGAYDLCLDENGFPMIQEVAMTEAEYWTEYDLIHANRGKTKAEIEKILKKAEKPFNLTKKK